jgi:Asp-tRNA(Asn)/Glu-tRNA(Gln) amidotransferase A subunit family amidase
MGDYYEKVFERYAFRDRVRTFFGQYDVLLSPVLPITSLEAGKNRGGFKSVGDSEITLRISDISRLLLQNLVQLVLKLGNFLISLGLVRPALPRFDALVLERSRGAGA